MFAKIPILGKLESNFVSIRVLENEGKKTKKSDLPDSNQRPKDYLTGVTYYSPPLYQLS